MSLLLLFSACVLWTAEEKAALLDPDQDGSDWPQDCDGSDPTILPGASELCDGVDQDCDGDIDEDAADATTWYADADGDGFGDAETTTASCEDPGESWVEGATDCDDTQSAVWPGAEVVCADRLVNDCEGEAGDEAQACALSGASDMSGEITLIGASSVVDDSLSGVQGFGSVLVGAGASLLGLGPGVQSDGLLVGAPEGKGLAAAVYWTASPWPGSDTYDPAAALEQATWTGSADAGTGAALASLGTICGEDSVALVVGSAGADTVTLVVAPDALDLEGPLAETATLGEMVGPSSFGSALGAEGLRDAAALVVGAPEADRGGGLAGFFLFTSEEDCRDPESVYAELDTPAEADGFGATVAAGDVTGDGNSDLFVSGDDDGAAALWFFEGPCAAEEDCGGARLELGELRGPITALQIIDFGGASSDACASDGVLDLVIGAPESGDDEQGQVMMLEGGSEVLSYNSDGIAARTGEEKGDRFGAALVVDSAAIGRERATPTPVLVVGAPGAEVVNKNNAPHDGIVYGWVGLDAWCGEGGELNPTFTLTGDTGDQLGAALTKGHDLDGDPAGLPEIVVGAPGHGEGAGIVYFVPLFPY